MFQDKTNAQRVEQVARTESSLSDLQKDTPYGSLSLPRVDVNSEGKLASRPLLGSGQTKGGNEPIQISSFTATDIVDAVYNSRGSVSKLAFEHSWKTLSDSFESMKSGLMNLNARQALTGISGLIGGSIGMVPSALGAACTYAGMSMLGLGLDYLKNDNVYSKVLGGAICLASLVPCYFGFAGQAIGSMYTNLGALAPQIATDVVGLVGDSARVGLSKLGNAMSALKFW